MPGSLTPYQPASLQPPPQLVCSAGCGAKDNPALPVGGVCLFYQPSNDHLQQFTAAGSCLRRRTCAASSCGKTLLIASPPPSHTCSHLNGTPATACSLLYSVV